MMQSNSKKGRVQKIPGSIIAGCAIACHSASEHRLEGFRHIVIGLLAVCDGIGACFRGIPVDAEKRGSDGLVRDLQTFASGINLATRLTRRRQIFRAPPPGYLTKSLQNRFQFVSAWG
jgi:hypothetical protein